MNKGWFRVRAGVRDGLIAVGVAAALLITGVSGQHPATGVGLLGYVLLAVGGLALAAGRRAPVAVLAVTGVCAVGYQAAGFDVAAVAFLFAVYAAMRAGHRLITVAMSVAVMASLPLAALVSGLHDAGEAFAQARGALQIAWLIAAGAAGEALRQAEQRADEAERTREEAARRRADEERLHIARELHDSLTHQISVIKVQSEAAVHVARKRGEPVPDALLVIREAGREASRELRATLEALRDDDTTPPHGLDHIPELVERAGRTGVRTTLTIQGRQHGVPAAVGRTVYRIVQESLTNVARHADATAASVHIDYRPDAVALRIDDNGKATPDIDPVPGIGLLGMRERVTALGGSLRAAPRDEGGFTVRAELPVESAA
ncbi:MULTISPECIES: sensor histidine kinase [Streptomyces]|uniref:histidine kinase n=1 Tax=Streptomyces venezuelae (strain ATCC 10712 / CBS 650.69 / DSM 40230 / JCM 4526 / NBRC 13096 / PD 04745) TaxID=953739 RepID=F2RBL7_STRVP|nr:histidine kinase [Streptomyces venezuelae]APE22532.1 two-component sensor histidine kinase [Streptomyces venezuelae]QER99913.1 sensor histidine kinase [Streptomyces venezuelae ATCC 10712]CCA56728.1 putative two-component system sensor kinase [Streptomyces venezuelae ATCC 10712]